ncbi:MAG TPA: tRNA (adenosine(37)-N6)-dimethylallyltransferase MiaA [Candidatus Binataceae bacterium]|nr:tRNA (adenosine(37)-N6)-dimethylallyltransferase MiaA [Candidatus Binataceae bacterium]
MSRVAFIVGPTGSGKSALALALAARRGLEIVNADSRQVYRGMDLGTAKPSAADRARVPHHLVDIREPDQPLDVAEFAALAREAIARIEARGRRALVVGGSGLYLRALRGGVFASPPASRELREALVRTAAERGVEHLHERLRTVDPDAAARIGHHDLLRIVRALEVYQLTGEPISVHQRRHGFGARTFESLVLGLNPERKRLYQDIDRRFDQMMEAGLLDEVRGLLARGSAPAAAPLNTIGYKHLAAHVRGELSLDAAVALARRDSRRLAKRQLTWFRHEPGIIWLDAARALEHASELLERFFAEIGCAA